MPNRPRSHRLEDESRLAFAQALDQDYLFRPEEREYGIDGEVEEFDQVGNATGLRYLVQLKATDATSMPGALRVQLPLETAAYYRSLSLPVLMVRYLSHGQHLFARWFHNNAQRSTGLAEKYMTFAWREEDAWNNDTSVTLAQEARAFLNLRSANLQLPVQFSIDVPTEVFGLTSPEIKLALRQAASSRPDVLKLIDTPGAGAGCFRVNKNELAVDLPSVEAATFSLGESYDAGFNGDQIAVDLLALAALAFENWGQADVAGRLALSFFVQSNLAGDSDAAVALSSAMARARQVREALDLSDQLDEDERPECQDLSDLFILPALHHARSSNAAEIDHYRATLTGRIERRIAREDYENAARDCVGLANSYRVRAEPGLAVEWYEKALEYDDGYNEHAHYWFELGGVLFGSHRYEEAAKAYGKAVELGSDDIARFLQADALLFAGDYGSARDLFIAAQDGSVSFGVAAEYGLKLQLLAELIDGLGITSQKRRPEQAMRKADVIASGKTDPSDIAGDMFDSLRLDGLCSLAWWNLAHNDRIQGDEETASGHFLNAALCNEGDVEAWANATIGVWFNGTLEFVPAILVTGQRMTGGALLPRLGVLAREQGEEFPRAEWIEQINKIVDELSDAESHSYAVRVIGPTGEVTTLEMPGAGWEPDAS